ncbi:MAG TPA: FdrA family protein, partial [Kiritimatiellia bacterium]|nr:FdrA family protein [Kiritimatiellia bacterium]
MVVKGVIKKGAYFDSVALMNVGRELSARDGVVDAAVVMGTKENKGILANSSLLLNEFKNAADTDLLIGIKAKTQAAAESAVKAAEELLAATRKQASGGSEDFKPMSLAGALEKIPDANLALISVAGRYAAGEAMKALAGGLHVMLFSDNVSIEDEKELKQFARKKGLLVMGPDCGTAIINGVPLAFANVVNRGDIGVVAASGT